MKFSNILALSTLLVATGVYADCQQIAGNYYCSEVEQVVYNNVGFSGSYEKVTNFNTDGTCNQESYSFSGNLAPLNEELSVHFRGPVNIKQFAFYSLGSSNSKREEGEAVNIAARHGHHVHKREYVTQYEYVTQTIVVGDDSEPTTVTDTQVAAPPPPATSSSSEAVVAVAVSSSSVETSSSVAPVVASSANNEVVGHSFGSSSSSSSSSSTAAPPSTFVTTTSSSSAAASSSSSAAPSASSSSSSSSAGGWTRSAYYDASSGTKSGLNFFNNNGGSGSGVFDYSFGSSLSYASSDGSTGASSAQTLEDVTLKSDEEIIIMSDTECNGDCGYYRPGIPAYHGFQGSSKLFLFEFSMPTATDSSSTYNYDMPAIWLLNAEIPRTLQYGAPSCSCWESGCGEFDLFEILNAGNNYLTNTLHSGQGSTGHGGGGGTSDYFARPTSGTLKAALIFDASTGTISITKLDDDTTFDSSISESTISGWLSKTSSNAGSTTLSS